MRSSMRLAISSGADAFAHRDDRPAPGLATLARILRLWLCRHRERQELARLGDMDALSAHVLRDIGLTRAEARAESAKPFWRA